MAENDEPIAERGLGRGDAELHLLVRQTEIGVGQRLPLVEALLLHLVEHGQKGGGRSHSRGSTPRAACELVKLFSISGREKTKRGGPAHLAGASAWFVFDYSNSADGTRQAPPRRGAAASAISPSSLSKSGGLVR